MASSNPDSMTNAQGEFTPSKPHDAPMTTSGHQPGKLVSEADRAGEFNLQTLPAGTAPPESTFQPKPDNETQAPADSVDILGGTTSADVHKGLGDPDTSKREGAGLDGLTSGGSGMQDEGTQEQRNLERETADQGPTTGHNASREGAEDREPVRAEEVAAERD